MTKLLSIVTLSLYCSLIWGFDIFRDYSGSTFFNGWVFYDNWDNLTFGNVNYLNESAASSQNLAYLNSDGHIIIKVDNTSYVNPGENRDSIRITTSDAWGVGSLWIIDLYHIPYGCSVWPAFCPNWPQDGEIDIIEAINVMPNNQYALHTTSGCFAYNYGGENGTLDSNDCSTASGCVVAEIAPNSFNSGFTSAGGGVYATQFDVTGIYMWFWSRPNVPSSITEATSTSSIDISSWGTPSASYIAQYCNITDYFTAQNIVIDITLCGDWAGEPYAYNATCGSYGPTGLCYNDTVVGPGSPTYDEAYFEIQYVRAYTTGGATVISATSTSSSTASTSSTSSSNGDTSSAGRLFMTDGNLMVISALTCIVGILIGTVIVC